MFRTTMAIRFSLVTACLVMAACSNHNGTQTAATYKTPNTCAEGKVLYCDSRSRGKCGCITQSEVKDFMAAF